MNQLVASPEKIREAFRAQIDGGKSIAVGEIVKITGGSKSTVAPVVRELVKEYAEELKAAKPAPPPQAFALGEDVVRRLFTLFTDVLSEHISQASQKWEDLLSVLHGCLKDRDAEVEQLQGQLEAANSRLEELARERDQANERARILESKALQTSEVASLVEQLRAMAANAPGAPQAAPDQSAEADPARHPEPPVRPSPGKAVAKAPSAKGTGKPGRKPAATAKAARTGRGRAPKQD